MTYPPKRLVEVVEFEYGKGIDKSQRDPRGEVPIYGANGILGRTHKALTSGEAIIVGRKGSAGELTRVSGKFWPSDVTYYVLGNDKIDIDYLFHFLKSANLPSLAVGVKPGINRNKVYSLEIPLPPIAEQKGIVARIEKQFSKIDEVVRLRAESIATTAALFPAALHAILSFAESKGWKMMAVGELCDIKGGKRLPKGQAFAVGNTNHPYIRVVDFIPYGIDQDDLKYITHETFKSISKYTISKDDIFISIAGTIGSTGIIPKSLDGANLTENAAKLTNLHGVDQRYLMYMLTSADAQSQMTGDMIQTTIAKLGLFRIARLKIPLPPTREQKQIVKKLDALSEKVRALREFQSAQAADFQSLKQSILHQAFQGSDA